MDGRILESDKFDYSPIDLGKIEAGTYFLRLSTPYNEIFKTVKIIKQWSNYSSSSFRFSWRRKFWHVNTGTGNGQQLGVETNLPQPNNTSQDYETYAQIMVQKIQ